jgi:hypothetical protein
LNAARAELTEAQQQLVAARGEEAKMRKVLEEEPQKDKTLGAWLMVVPSAVAGASGTAWTANDCQQCCMWCSALEI